VESRVSRGFSSVGLVVVVVVVAVVVAGVAIVGGIGKAANERETRRKKNRWFYYSFSEIVLSGFCFYSFH
jgi:type II secretory pathway pseudopilin PulG